MKKLVDGVLVDLTAEEIATKQADETEWNDGVFNRAIKNLRNKRNQLLAETDHYALSDQTLSDDMRTYRQDLRDITEGLTTVEEVNAVVFPTKP
jgi:type II secretory ATPase GspE/PulE/Tfp pilus assembly ATPase PilB-like protein